jgi:uncharacterized membrane protein
MHEQFLMLAQTVPTYGAYDFVMLAARILHVIGAIILVGGLFYLWAVVTPSASSAAKDNLPSDNSLSLDRYFGGSRAAWAKWVGIASAFLLVTGLWNFVNMVTANKLHFTYHILGTLKILLALALMMLAALLAGRTAAADAIRRNWRRWLVITLFIGIITVTVGSIMRTYPRTPKIDTPPPAPILIAP